MLTNHITANQLKEALRRLPDPRSYEKDYFMVRIREYCLTQPYYGHEIPKETLHRVMTFKKDRINDDWELVSFPLLRG